MIVHINRFCVRENKTCQRVLLNRKVYLPEIQVKVYLNAPNIKYVNIKI